MSEALWEAPRARGPLDAEVWVPGSKSETNRALVMALLATSATRIRGVLSCRDCDLMIAAIESFGATVTRLADDTLEVVPPVTLRAAENGIECGLAGTVMRFLTPIAALCEGDTRFDGDEEARVRPMGGLLDALSALGVSVTYEGIPGHLPYVIHGRGGLPGGRVSLDASASSQFLSALLLVGPRCDADLEIVTGPEVPSRPHVDMTVSVMRARGGQVDPLEMSVTPFGDVVTAWRVHSGALPGGQWQVAPDLTNAGPFLAAPLIAGGQVRILNWPTDTTQPGGAWRGLLTRMGGRANCDDEGGFLSQYMGPISGLDENLSDYGELVPTLCALAAFAVTPSRMSGIGHLRGHETDRLSALSDTLTALGVRVREGRSSLSIDPAPMRGCVVDSYADHRMAMTAALLGLGVEGVRVRGMSAVTKTFPGFVDVWTRMVRGEGGA